MAGLSRKPRQLSRLAGIRIPFFDEAPWRWYVLKVDIAEPEAVSLLQMMDLDRDGAVSVDDFMVRVSPLQLILCGATSGAILARL